MAQNQHRSCLFSSLPSQASHRILNELSEDTKVRTLRLVNKATTSDVSRHLLDRHAVFLYPTNDGSTEDHENSPSMNIISSSSDLQSLSLHIHSLPWELRIAIAQELTRCPIPIHWASHPSLNSGGTPPLFNQLIGPEVPREVWRSFYSSNTFAFSYADLSALVGFTNSTGITPIDHFSSIILSISLQDGVAKKDGLPSSEALISSLPNLKRIGITIDPYGYDCGAAVVDLFSAYNKLRQRGFEVTAGYSFFSALWGVHFSARSAFSFGTGAGMPSWTALMSGRSPVLKIEMAKGAQSSGNPETQAAAGAPDTGPAHDKVGLPTYLESSRL